MDTVSHARVEESYSPISGTAQSNEPHSLGTETNISGNDEPIDSLKTKSATKSKLWLKITLPLVIIVGSVGLVSLITMVQPEAEKKPVVETTPLVETQALVTTDTQFYVESQGTVIPRTETTLVTEVSGVVESVSGKFHAGGFFTEGEIILAIDNSDYEAAVKQAQANLLGKQAQLTQEIALAEQAEKEWRLTGKPISDAPILALRQPFLEKAKADVLFAEAELQQAQRKLNRTQIRAPYDGLVKTKSVDKGQYLTIGNPIVELVAVDTAEVRLPLAETDLAFLTLPSPKQALNQSDNQLEGPTVLLTGNIGGKTQEWPAKIIRTEGIIDTRSRMHYAVAEIDDPYGLHQKADVSPLPVGSFVTAKITGNIESGVASVPRSVIRDDNTMPVIDEHKQLQFRPVTLVRTDREFAYVRGDFNPGDKTVTTPIAVPVAGMALRTVDTQ